MKPAVVLLVISVALSSGSAGFSATPAPPSQSYDMTGRWYTGGGFQYDIASFKKDYMDVDGLGLDNTWGLQLKGGYFITNFIAVECLFQHHHKFEWDSSDYSYLGVVGDASVEVRAFDFSVNAKGFLPLEQFRPYVVAGLGFARGKGTLKIDTNIPFVPSISESETDSGPFGRIGVGVDFLLNDQFGLEGEIAYNAGLGDIDYARFTALSVSALFFF